MNSSKQQQQTSNTPSNSLNLRTQFSIASDRPSLPHFKPASETDHSPKEEVICKEHLLLNPELS